MSEINVIVNNMPLTVAQGQSIMAACQANGFEIPGLCNHPELEQPGDVCGICVVEVAGSADLIRACKTPVKEGMVIRTDSDRVIAARKEVLSRMIQIHPNDCLTCFRVGGDCVLQNLCYRYEVENNERRVKGRGTDSSSAALVREMDKCIGCGNCVAMCREIQSVGIYQMIEEDDGYRYADTENRRPLADTACINCGQCVKVCPVGALTERIDLHPVFQALRDPSTHVIAQIAPAVKHTLCEEFALAPGTDLTAKLPGSLRLLGVDRVFDTDFAADLTIMEEAAEFIHRLKHGGPFPLLTSCSPGWITFAEHRYPQLLPNLSTCKSPQQMFGALAKSYYPEKFKVRAKDIFHLSIMPCTAKKYEAARPEMRRNGIPDVDAVLTTREFAKLLKLERINPADLADSRFDRFLSRGTGAARIFAGSGGVMEAALRTAVFLLTDGKRDTLDFTCVRGVEAVRQATLNIAGTTIHVAVASSTGAACKLLDRVVSGEETYHFIEIMGCPGGCIGGGGAPLPDDPGIKQQRSAAIYARDTAAAVRRSHENSEVQHLYREFLGSPGSRRAHELLHTRYSDRSGRCPPPDMA